MGKKESTILWMAMTLPLWLLAVVVLGIFFILLVGSLSLLAWVALIVFFFGEK